MALGYVPREVVRRDDAAAREVVSMIAQEPWRPDEPNVGVFANFRDAIAEASFRAALTQRRYRVRYEPHNCWWQITDVGKLLRRATA